MERYKNLGGDSSVARYEIAETSIIVEFKDNSAYLYSHVSPGPAHVAQLKALAVAGQGLNGFISRHIKKRYEKRLR